MSADADASFDRATGALLGLAVGDAVGTTLEFRPRDSYVHITDMVGGGPFDLKPGGWTDDTSMALALADSLENMPEFDEKDLLARFVAWWRHGRYSHNDLCFDIGMTTRAALARFEESDAPHCGSPHPEAAGNGSLMRLAPVAIRFHADRPRLVDIAARQSKTTHAAPEAVSACVAFAEVLADAIEGQPKPEVLRPRAGDYAGTIAPVMAGGWRALTRKTVGSSGYVVHSLAAALWCVERTENYRDAVLLAANLGDDADTTAAITGQLAGVLYGASGIPGTWVVRLAWSDAIRATAGRLARSSRGTARLAK